MFACKFTNLLIYFIFLKESATCRPYENNPLRPLAGMYRPTQTMAGFFALPVMPYRPGRACFR